MLRAIVVAVGALLVLAGLAGLLTFAFPGAFAALIIGAVILGGTLYEKIRYKPIEAERPGGPWEKTAERFIDDETGNPVTVYVNRATGERKYVNE